MRWLRHGTERPVHILPVLGNTQLAKITPTQVREWHAGLSEILGPNTVAKCYRLLRSILTTAVDDERIPRSPCKIRGGGKEQSIERPTATAEQVWELAELMPKRFRCMVLLAGFGNLRLSEQLGLERRRVNPLQSKVSVVQGEHQLAHGELILTEPKSAAGRRIFILPGSLMAELVDHLEEFTGPEPSSRVFTGERGGSLRRHVFSKYWRDARGKVDLPEGFVFHDLRHTAQTLGGRAGATLADLKRRGGHSNVEAVMRYQHATEEGDRQVAEGMDILIVDARSRRAMNAPSPPLVNAAENPTDPRVAAENGDSPAALPESGRRESNPRSQLGKLNTIVWVA